MGPNGPKPACASGHSHRQGPDLCPCRPDLYLCQRPRPPTGGTAAVRCGQFSAFRKAEHGLLGIGTSESWTPHRIVAVATTPSTGQWPWPPTGRNHSYQCGNLKYTRRNRKERHDQEGAPHKIVADAIAPSSMPMATTNRGKPQLPMWRFIPGRANRQPRGVAPTDCGRHDAPHKPVAVAIKTSGAPTATATDRGEPQFPSKATSAHTHGKNPWEGSPPAPHVDDPLGLQPSEATETASDP